MNGRRVARVAAMVGLALAATGCLPPIGSGYQLVRLPVAGGDAARSSTQAINDAGQILGLSDDGAVLWTDGEPTTLPASGGALLNERGEVLYMRDQPTLWRDGATTTITTPTPTVPAALDDHGRALLAPQRSSAQEYYLWEEGDLRRLEGFPTVRDPAFVTVADMNDHGQVIGEVRPSRVSWPTLSFVWEDGRLTDLGSLGGGRTVANAINDRGQIAGTSDLPDGHRHAFLWDDGVMTDVGSLPGGDFSDFGGLSDAGHVVGTSGTATGESHAYRWRRGTMIDLGTLGGNFSSAAGVNNRGHVIGLSTVDRTGSNIAHGYAWRNGRLHDLGALGDESSHTADINDRGEIVGYAWTPDGRSHAVLWTPRRRQP